jgi:hypothetical protein
LLGAGICTEGSRVAAISPAVAVSEAIGRIARPAIATPAKTASRVPPRIPAAISSQTRSIVESTWARLRPYWT